MPEVVLVDQGREFGKDFGTKVTEAGALLRTIGARAPWQQGRTERHGGLAKELFVKVREEVLPTSWGEWKMCIHAVEAAKNRLFNRSGFSPAHRQLGYNLRLPGSLGADDIYDPVMMVQSTSADVQRLLEIRHQAMQAFIKHTTNTAIVRAAKARSRVGSDIQVGDTVYVYRVPLQRRRKAEEDLEDREGRRATWVGPGVVVMTEGANAWLSIRGELWKCAKEQLRRATAEEAEARELLQQDFEELQQSMVRRASKRGFRDVTSWQRPAAEGDEDPEEEPPRQRPRIEEPAEDPRHARVRVLPWNTSGDRGRAHGRARKSRDSTECGRITSPVRNARRNTPSSSSRCTVWHTCISGDSIWTPQTRSRDQGNY